MPAPPPRALVVLAASLIAHLIRVIGVEDGAARWIKVPCSATSADSSGRARPSGAGRCTRSIFFNDSDLGHRFALVLAASAYGVRTATRVGNSATRETLARVPTSKSLMASRDRDGGDHHAWILYTVDFLPPSFNSARARAGYWACAGLIGFRLAPGWEQFLFLTVDDSDSERQLSEKA